MTMAELKAELTNIADHFMILATEQRDKDQGISYQAFHVNEICRKAAENLQQDPVEAELEGGGHTWWYVCGECHGAIDDSDRYCKHCGRPLKNQVIRDIEKKRKLEEEWVESEFGIYREN